MQRYMAAIYAMTTVNHDHLFASLVRFSPCGSFEEPALRRKLYLIATAASKMKGLHLHHSLQENQIHLLTDDRFCRIRDFLSVAVEKGILERNGQRLIKDRSKFSSPYDFHRARIDNPIEVAANAVEPLVALQRLVRRTAWMPDFWVKRKVIKMLNKQTKEEFDTDYYKVLHKRRVENKGCRKTLT